MSTQTLTRQQILDLVNAGHTVIYKGRAIRSASDPNLPIDDAAILADFPEGLTGNVLIGSGATASELRFFEPSGGGTNYTAFKAQLQANDLIYTLPSSQSAGMLKNDGSGLLTWEASAGGGLAVGTTAITSGAAGRMLYETSGNTLGEIAGSSVDSNGAVQFAATARSSGVAQYFRVTTPADTGQTTATESVGAYFGGNGSGATVTRTWSAGTVALQRENVFVAPTYAGASATATFTESATVSITGGPAMGSNAARGASRQPVALNIENGLLRLPTQAGAYGSAATTGIVFGASSSSLAIYADANSITFGQAYGPFGIVPGDGTVQMASTSQFIWVTPGYAAYKTGAGLTGNSTNGIIRVSNGSTGAGKLIIGTSSASTTAADLYAVGSSSSLVPVRIDSAATPSVDIFQTTVNGVAGTGFVVTSTGAPSSPGAAGSTTSERYGQTSTANTDRGTAIGAASTASAAAGTAIGASTLAGTAAVAVGAEANAGSGNTSSTVVGYQGRGGDRVTAIGFQAGKSVYSADNTFVGYLAGPDANTWTGSVALGNQSIVTASNQFVSGSSSWPVTNIFFGKGVTNATPTAFTINGTGGSGSNVAGADVNVASGRGTGTGNSGKINFQIALPAASTGSSLNALSNVLQLGSGATIPYFSLITPANIGLTATAEFVGAYFGGNGSGSTVTRTWAAGTVASQSENVFVAPTYAGASATAIFTKAATLNINGGPIAGASASITNSYGVAIGPLASASAASSRYGGAVTSGMSSLALVTASDSEIIMAVAASGEPRITLGKGSQGAFWTVGNGFVLFGGQSSNNLTLYSGGAARVLLDTSGLMTIGTNSAASAQAHVISQSASRVGLRVDSAATPTASIAEFYNNTAQAFVIKKDGFYVTNSSAGGNTPEYWMYTLPWNSGFGLGQGNWGGDSISIAMSGNQSPYFKLGSSGVLGWSATQYGTTANVTNSDLILRRAAAATLQMGTDAAAPVTQAIKAHDGAGTNIAGAPLNISGGKGTGTGTGGSVNIQTAIVGSSGSALNTLVDRYIVNGARKTLTDASTNLFEVALPTLKGCMGTISYEIFATDGTDVQVRSGIARYSAVNKAGAYTSEIAIVNEAISASSGTLTATFAVTGGTNKITISVTPSGSLTETIYYILYTIENNSEQAITVL